VVEVDETAGEPTSTQSEIAAEADGAANDIEPMIKMSASKNLFTTVPLS
jgi:hypothetical protein